MALQFSDQVGIDRSRYSSLRSVVSNGEKKVLNVVLERDSISWGEPTNVSCSEQENSN